MVKFVLLTFYGILLILEQFTMFLNLVSLSYSNWPFETDSVAGKWSEVLYR